MRATARHDFQPRKTPVQARAAVTVGVISEATIQVLLGRIARNWSLRAGQLHVCRRDRAITAAHRIRDHGRTKGVDLLRRLGGIEPAWPRSPLGALANHA